MAPHSDNDNGHSAGHTPSAKIPLEPGLSEAEAAAIAKQQMPRGSHLAPPSFNDPYKERAYFKGRLAAAFRIFAKYGYDEGVAGDFPCLPSREARAQQQTDSSSQATSPTATPLSRIPSGSTPSAPPSD